MNVSTSILYGLVLTKIEKMNYDKVNKFVQKFKNLQLDKSTYPSWYSTYTIFLEVFKHNIDDLMAMSVKDKSIFNLTFEELKKLKFQSFIKKTHGGIVFYNGKLNKSTEISVKEVLLNYDYKIQVCGLLYGTSARTFIFHCSDEKDLQNFYWYYSENREQLDSVLSESPRNYN